jgi:hypothetical protein
MRSRCDLLVVDRAGLPQTDARVRITPADPHGDHGLFNAEQGTFAVESIRTNDDGHVVGWLEPGVYHASVVPPSRLLGCETLNVGHPATQQRLSLANGWTGYPGYAPTSCWPVAAGEWSISGVLAPPADGGDLCAAVLPPRLRPQESIALPALTGKVTADGTEVHTASVAILHDGRLLAPPVDYRWLLLHVTYASA